MTVTFWAQITWLPSYREWGEGEAGGLPGESRFLWGPWSVEGTMPFHFLLPFPPSKPECGLHQPVTPS